MATGQRLRRIEGPLGDQIRALAVEHPDWSAAEIHRATGERVNVRTVQRFLRDFAGRDTSDRWGLEDAEPEDVPLVLGVVRHIGGMAYPTRAVAAWLVRLQRAFPELTERPVALYHLASIAVRGEVAKVQDWLTYTPWLDGGLDYARAFAAGRIATFTLPGGIEYPDSTWDIVKGAAQ